MKQEQEMVSLLLDWAQRNDHIRTVLLTSSRANPYAFTDLFTDYDFEIFVDDLDVFMSDDGWLDQFGVLIKKVVLQDGNWRTRLVLYEDGTKIDFQISTNDFIKSLAELTELPAKYDNGYKVLLDKDGLTKGIPAPSYKAYFTRKPSEEIYTEIINSFWGDTAYVANSLWRDELYFAKYMLDNVIRFNYLQPAIEWYLGVKHDWSINPNKFGRWFKRYLDPGTWSELEGTYAGAGIEENWEALFRTADLFSRMAKEVGESLGYQYPMEYEQKMRAYLLKVRNLPAEAERFE
ncbi:aminoglycoside 6-adenylyltransferase [Bacillus sp. ISL-35]|uniref:aminoglycoside 6-adenylyltransferase n=1 Tax=Bacillus sp. ISL-35 TaxID=2819122 RepID=UPI001BED1592|nr:aminoglycoside 6-adenylyltransferase [Bacillus sp. ISL-35]MBT2680103.1 aminoglycoside 6-adenylyltransferase [Bacillus sp. ISL-35]MBT2704377.1 aminoglycoside 6-adenylyltransferase [Chryseobacterium sp. ISL-80]